MMAPARLPVILLNTDKMQPWRTPVTTRKKTNDYISSDSHKAYTDALRVQLLNDAAEKAKYKTVRICQERDAGREMF